MPVNQMSLQTISNERGIDTQRIQNKINNIQQQTQIKNTRKIEYSGGRIRSVKVSNFSITNIVNTMKTRDGKRPHIHEDENNKTVSTNITEDLISFDLTFDVDNKSSLPFILPSISNATFTIPSLAPIDMKSSSMGILGPNGSESVTVKGKKDFANDDSTWGKTLVSVVVLFYLEAGLRPKDGIEIKSSFSTPVYSQSIDAKGPTIKGPSSYTSIINGTKTHHGK